MYIYAGEDLPQGETKSKETVEAPKQSIKPTAGALDAFSANEIDLLASLAEEISALAQNSEIKVAHERCESLENEEKVALWSLLDSKTRSALKRAKVYIA
jgi:hypothetical protein